MSDRLTAAVAELVDALREELRSQPAATTERLISIRDAADRLSVGRTSVYAEVSAGRLRTVQVGRRRLVPESAVAAYTDAGR